MQDERILRMNKKGRLLFIWFLAFCGTGLSQSGPPGSAQSPGERLREEGDVLGAIAEFRKAYLQDPKDQKNIYDLARALSVNASRSGPEKADECFKFLSLAVEMKPSLAPLIEPDFLTVRKDRRWPAFEDKLVAALNAGSGHPVRDVEYAKALWRLRARDQAYFAEVGIAGRKVGMRSSVQEAIWDLKLLMQEQSQKELDGLLARKGWPRAADVGPEAAFAAYLVLMHGSYDLQEKYMPAIWQACKAKELPWERYANIFDRCLFNQNKPQRYGTHTRYNERTKREELYPLEDESKVNEWRKELGLPPLEEYLKTFDIVFRPKK
jgi:hypothetical protein